MNRRSPVRAGVVIVFALAALATAPVSAAADRYLWQQEPWQYGFGWAGANDFNEGGDHWDTEVADDFTVPAGRRWRVNRIVVWGAAPKTGYIVYVPTFFPRTFDVALHAADGGRPADRPSAAVVADTHRWADISLGITGSKFLSGGGEVILELPEPLEVPSGTWWLSVRANEQPVGTVGYPTAHFFWSNAIGRGAPAHYRNPGGGGTSGCRTWTRRDTCDDGLYNTMPGPDQYFALEGTEVDTTPPETTITAGPSGSSRSPSATFSFAASETDSTLECRLDTGAWTPCTSPATYGGLADGSHTFAVAATDPAGNVDATPATRTWRVDTRAPSILSVSPAPDAIGVRPEAAVSVTFSEPMSRTAAQQAFALTRGTTKLGGAFSWSGTTMTFDPAGDLARDTQHTATVTTAATDEAGNPLASPASWRFRTVRSMALAPAAATVTTGTLRAGTAAALQADDGSLLQVASTTSGTRATAWHGTFVGVPNTASGLRVLYRGSNSSSCTQVVAVHRWTDRTWTTVASGAVGTTETAVAAAVPGAQADHVSGTAGDGEVHVRVSCTGGTAFTVRADQLRLAFDRP